MCINDIIWLVIIYIFMMHSPLFLTQYSTNPEEACMQRTGELIITKTIDPELERIKSSLFYIYQLSNDFENNESLISHIQTILTKEYEKPLIEEFDRFITKVPTLLTDPGISDEAKSKIEQEVEEKKKILFELESDTDLAIDRLHYYYNLEAIKESITYVIQQPRFLSHLIKKHKHSSKVRIYLYRQFFRKEYTVCYEAYDSIYAGIDYIDNDISLFKNRLKQK